MRIVDKKRFAVTLIIIVILFSLYVAIGTIERRVEAQIGSGMCMLQSINTCK